MNWLTFDMVLAFHQEALVSFGGEEGVRDEGLLRSALARPAHIAAYEEGADIFRLAAAYCHGIVMNHPFIDGNKRTGILAAVVFLSLNGTEVTFEEPDIAAFVLGLAASDFTEAQLAEWLRRAAE
ncbi:MAG: type II toxin-antitoxin system death-on-curing family toxin [Proteobacteria bacterium]|nr:type II toxin-antitoxin system death-on-curing family toxin [Pseudomonadota bacterium]